QFARLTARLRSRLAGGLVVGITPFGPDSRRVFLEERARRRGLRLGREALGWLAEQFPGSARQLDGALAQVAALGRGEHAVTVEMLVGWFATESAARKLTVERIAQRVGKYFRVETQQLQSRSRTRQALVPRQVGMYLARRLTNLSLDQIGAYFGGRDHSTVLHACRKVEQALTSDAGLSGAVRQLH